MCFSLYSSFILSLTVRSYETQPFVSKKNLPKSYEKKKGYQETSTRLLSYDYCEEIPAFGLENYPPSCNEQYHEATLL